MTGYNTSTEDVVLRMKPDAPAKNTVCCCFTKVQIIALVCVVVAAGVIAGIVVAVTSMGGDDDDQTATTTVTTIATATATTMATATATTTTTTTTTNTATTSTTTTTAPPMEGIPDQERIDCYPEEHWATPPENVDRSKCEARGCTYAVPQSSAAPSCYVSPDSRMGAGYRMEGEMIETLNGFRVSLVPNNEAMYEGLLERVWMDVEYRTASALRFKVRIAYEEFRLNLKDCDNTVG